MEVLSAGGARVWIENHPTEGWAPGRVDSVAANGCYIVVDDQGGKFEVKQEDARPVDPNCLRGVDDLLSLGDFNEGALLHNVRSRYFNDSIYTGIGSPILISVNPFQNLPGLYSEAKQKFYREQSVAAGSSEEANLPPHLFSVAAASYRAMLNDAKNQSIIISGESGAGKTEATKKVLTYFANLQSTSGEAKKMSIEEQVLRSNPILEAFGNAKTIRNDNSSRFGKFIDIEFDPSGKLTSARISNYLLEKSRIVKQQPDERGYHVFYQICAGASMLDIGMSLGLRSADEHAYTSVCTEIDGVDDSGMFQEALECMDGLGFSSEEKHSVFQLVAAVLHMGDLSFKEGSDGSLIEDSNLAEKICELLQVSRESFTTTFQYKTLEDPFSRQMINMPQDPANSSNTRHSMAKHLYSRLFDWLVWRINQSTAGSASGKKEAMKKIGILDIYGFEVFDWNSFEQLCINFANEKLQQHFNSHMFTMEQRLYTEEGISWSHIEWQDNREIIDSLEKKPAGLFCILDSECLMPNATDDTCLSKIHNTFRSSRVVYKTSRFKSTNFAVAHYAGEVVYDVQSFIEKNTDKLHADIINLLASSSMPIARKLFSDPRFAPDGQAGQAARSAASPPHKRGDANQRAKQNVTVSMMFRQQLDQLVEDLNRTNPRYIRCIKPNGNKQAREMDSIEVQRQLRCAGMLESIRIRRAGYPVRRPFKEFYNRFRILCPHVSPGKSADPDYKELSRRVLTDVEAKLKPPLDPKSWQIGRSKVFLKEEVQSGLEKAIGEAVKVYVLRIQRRWRGFRCRRRFRAMQQAAVQVQAGLRSLRALAELQRKLRQRDAGVKLQAALRMLCKRQGFVQKRLAVLRIQTRLRGWLCRRRFARLKKAKLAGAPVDSPRADTAVDLRASAQRVAAPEPHPEGLQKREERSQAEALRNELRDLKLGRLHLESPPPPVQVQAEKTAELQQLRTRAVQAEEELEQSQQRLQSLQQELRQRSDGDRSNSLDQLRSELLSRIESSNLTTSQRPSIVLNEDGRKSILNQRELFEKLKQQFDEASKEKPPELLISNDREIELEEELRQLRKEQVELKIKLTCVEDEFHAKCSEAKQLLASCSGLKAEVDDLKMQLEQESALTKKQVAKVQELQASLLSAETEGPSLRKRLQAAEAQVAQAREDAQAADQRFVRLEEDRELLKRQLRQVEASTSASAERERAFEEQLRHLKDQLEVEQSARESAERGRSQSESSQRWLQSEHERLKAELSEINAERAKLRQLVDEVLKAKQDNEVEKWKRKAQSLEQECKEAKQLSAEMNKVMEGMTQALSGGASLQKVLQQLEQKNQELKAVKRDRDEAQKSLDEKQSSGEFFKDKWRSAEEKIRSLNEENSDLSAANEKLRKRLETDVKVPDLIERPPTAAPTSDVEELREQVRSFDLDIKQKDAQLKQKEAQIKQNGDELNRSKEYAEKTQLVNECLNSLLQLESEQTHLYEKICKDKGIHDLHGIAEKKAKAALIVSKLNQCEWLRKGVLNPEALSANAA